MEIIWSSFWSVELEILPGYIVALLLSFGHVQNGYLLPTSSTLPILNVRYTLKSLIGVTPNVFVKMYVGELETWTMSIREVAELYESEKSFVVEVQRALSGLHSTALIALERTKEVKAGLVQELVKPSTLAYVKQWHKSVINLAAQTHSFHLVAQTHSFNQASILIVHASHPLLILSTFGCLRKTYHLLIQVLSEGVKEQTKLEDLWRITRGLSLKEFASISLHRSLSFPLLPHGTQVPCPHAESRKRVRESEYKIWSIGRPRMRHSCYVHLVCDIPSLRTSRAREHGPGESRDLHRTRSGDSEGSHQQQGQWYVEEVAAVVRGGRNSSPGSGGGSSDGGNGEGGAMTTAAEWQATAMAKMPTEEKEEKNLKSNHMKEYKERDFNVSMARAELNQTLQEIGGRRWRTFTVHHQGLAHLKEHQGLMVKMTTQVFKLKERMVWGPRLELRQMRKGDGTDGHIRYGPKTGEILRVDWLTILIRNDHLTHNIIGYVRKLLELTSIHETSIRIEKCVDVGISLFGGNSSDIGNQTDVLYESLTDIQSIDMARVKAIVSKQDVDGEPTRIQCWAEVAMTFTSPSAPADRDKRRQQTASYQKDKQQATQTSSKYFNFAKSRRIYQSAPKLQNNWFCMRIKTSAGLWDLHSNSCVVLEEPREVIGEIRGVRRSD
ncbi:hypothetical protein Syun_003412 [Stephania yunnanensis]|uniref:Uncharacterized protein n=1 Tax=Stephania yunnanensis TaxID=152371 RepID=A0AAP0L3Q0_9MAGN